MPNQFQTKLRKSRQIEVNFTRIQHLRSERAYNEISIKILCLALFRRGYKTSLMLLPIHWLFEYRYGRISKHIVISIALKNERPLNLLPAFWPIEDTDVDWNLLKTIANTNLGIILMNFITVAVGLWLTAFMDWGCCLKKRKKHQKFWKQ
jgi:hypothetical protein